MKSFLIGIGSLCLGVVVFSPKTPSQTEAPEKTAWSQPRLETPLSKVWNELQKLRTQRIEAWKANSFRTRSEAFQGLKAATISREEITSLFAQRGISSYLNGPKRATDPGLLQKIVESENHKMRRVFIERSSALSKLPYGDVDAVNALLHD